MASRGSVLHLSQNLTLPFDRRVWMELNALKGAGYDVSAICPMGDGGTLPYEELNGIHIWRYPPPPEASGFASYAWEFLYCWLQTARLTITVLARRGFDVIHSATRPTRSGRSPPSSSSSGASSCSIITTCARAVPVALRRQGRGLVPALRALQWLERMQFATADMVISTTVSVRQADY